MLIHTVCMFLALLIASRSQAQPNADRAAPAAVGGETAAHQAHQALDEAYNAERSGNPEAARTAFERARAAGADAQVVWFELGRLALARGDKRAAREAFGHAGQGADAELANDASRELAGIEPETDRGEAPVNTLAPKVGEATSASALLDLAYYWKAAHDRQRAQATFRAAEHAGADAQLVALELSYLSLEGGDRARAKLELERASTGPDAQRSKQARDELAGLQTDAAAPRHFWADIYAEAFGWTRVAGENRDSDLVPSLRVRGFFTPFTSLDLHLYVFGQVTRDVASRSAGAGGLPLIYADNSALFGPGLLLRLWGHRLGLYAQLGPAIELVDDTKKRVSFDARVGAHLGLESHGCWPAAQGGSRWSIVDCHELYAEATYVNRYQNDVIGFARGRSSLSVAVTGPLEWQLTGELRVAADSNGEYYNNFADLGIGPRLRLLAPIRVDLMFAPHVGSYFGRHHLDPSPTPLNYLDLRAQVATYIEL